MDVTVLRLGHRIFRDQRITTHVFLTARALGAGKGLYTGQHDEKMERSVESVAKEFGGNFKVTYIDKWRLFLEKWKGDGGKIAHLTVYGLPFEQQVQKIKGKLLIVVGGEKVPPEVYQMADWNVSVGNQPHSEVAALGLFLYEHAGRKMPSFNKAKLKVIPQERGKKVVRSV